MATTKGPVLLLSQPAVLTDFPPAPGLHGGVSEAPALLSSPPLTFIIRFYHSLLLFTFISEET